MRPAGPPDAFSDIIIFSHHSSSYCSNTSVSALRRNRRYSTGTRFVPLSALRVFSFSEGSRCLTIASSLMHLNAT